MIVRLEQGSEDCLVEVPIRLPLIEVERLLRIVDRSRRSGEIPASSSDGSDTAPENLATLARFLASARRRRDAAFPGIEFGEPAWDMLLDLYVQHVEGRKVSVSSLCTAAAVPPTTALRWIETLTNAGQFIRSPDPLDGRRVHVSLAPTLISAIELYLTDVRRRATTAL